MFHQGLADTPDNSADRLAARGLRIDHSATVVRAYKTVQTHEPKVGINTNFGEDGGEAEGRFRSLGAGVVLSLTGQRGDIIASEQILVGHNLPRKGQTPCAGEDFIAVRVGEGRKLASSS